MSPTTAIVRAQNRWVDSRLITVPLEAQRSVDIPSSIHNVGSATVSASSVLGVRRSDGVGRESLTLAMGIPNR